MTAQRLHQGDTGIKLVLNAARELATASDVLLSCKRPDNTTFVASIASGTLTVGASTTALWDAVLSATATFEANNYVVYALVTADLNSAGKYYPRLTYLNTSANQRIKSNRKTADNQLIFFQVYE